MVAKATQRSQGGVSFTCKGFLRELNPELFLKDVNCENDVGKALRMESAGNFAEEEFKSCVWSASELT